jgi:hypothetical protein
MAADDTPIAADEMQGFALSGMSHVLQVSMRPTALKPRCIGGDRRVIGGHRRFPL